MGEHRVDLLEDRVERLRERTEQLQDEFDSVRRRTRQLHSGDPAGTGEQTDPADGRTASRRPRTALTDHGLDLGPNGASDEEVEAAIRRVETDTDDEPEDREREEIIVA